MAVWQLQIGRYSIIGACENHTRMLVLSINFHKKSSELEVSYLFLAALVIFVRGLINSFVKWSPIISDKLYDWKCCHNSNGLNLAIAYPPTPWSQNPGHLLPVLARQPFWLWWSHVILWHGFPHESTLGGTKHALVLQNCVRSRPPKWLPFSHEAEYAIVTSIHNCIWCAIKALWCPIVCRTRSNGWKLKGSVFWLNCNKNGLTVWAVWQWERLPLEVVGIPLLEVFKRRLGNTLPVVL